MCRVIILAVAVLFSTIAYSDTVAQEVPAIPDLPALPGFSDNSPASPKSPPPSLGNDLPVLPGDLPGMPAIPSSPLSPSGAIEEGSSPPPVPDLPEELGGGSLLEELEAAQEPSTPEDKEAELEALLKAIEEDTVDEDKRRRRELENVEKEAAAAGEEEGPSKRNWKTQHLPEVIYRKQYDRRNRHLPKSITPEDLDAFLFAAASRGDVNGVRAILDTGRTPDPRNIYGNTPLINAALGGHPGAVRLLLARGADANAQNDLGLTALHIAAHKGIPEMVTALLHMGANPNLQNKQGLTPLQFAATSRNYASVRTLLEGGARREARFYSELVQNPNMVASAKRHSVENLRKQEEARIKQEAQEKQAAAQKRRQEKILQDLESYVKTQQDAFTKAANKKQKQQVLAATRKHISRQERVLSEFPQKKISLERALAQWEKSLEQPPLPNFYARILKVDETYDSLKPWAKNKWLRDAKSLQEKQASVFQHYPKESRKLENIIARWEGVIAADKKPQVKKPQASRQQKPVQPADPSEEIRKTYDSIVEINKTFRTLPPAKKKQWLEKAEDLYKRASAPQYENGRKRLAAIIEQWKKMMEADAKKPPARAAKPAVTKESPAAPKNPPVKKIPVAPLPEGTPAPAKKEKSLAPPPVPAPSGDAWMKDLPPELMDGMEKLPPPPSLPEKKSSTPSPSLPALSDLPDMPAKNSKTVPAAPEETRAPQTPVSSPASEDESLPDLPALPNMDW